MNAQIIAAQIRRVDLSFADMSLLISAIECRLVQAGSVQNMATEDASVRLIQAIDELGQLRECSAEESKAIQASFFGELERDARKEAA